WCLSNRCVSPCFPLHGFFFPCSRCANPHCSLSAAEEPTQRAIDEYVANEMETQRIPGLSLAVVQSGKLVLAKGYGKASLELDASATATTLYGLCSISKQFTATAIMLLILERKIGLDDRLTNY